MEVDFQIKMQTCYGAHNALVNWCPGPLGPGHSGDLGGDMTWQFGNLSVIPPVFSRVAGHYLNVMSPVQSPPPNAGNKCNVPA